MSDFLEIVALQNETIERHRQSTGYMDAKNMVWDTGKKVQINEQRDD